MDFVDDFGKPQVGWTYRLKWHNYHLKDTMHERPITWQAFGPRPNDRPISFWSELRKQKVIPPLQNPDRTRAKRKEMFQLLGEEEKRAAETADGGAKTKHVEKTEDEWMVLWMALKPEWEPVGTMGLKYKAPVRLESESEPNVV
jgi:hypothetical protein